VADRLYAALSKPPKFENPPAPPQGEPVPVSGQWEARLEFGRGSAVHTLMFEQNGPKLLGTHHTEFYSTDLNGNVAADTIRFQSSWQIQGQRLSYAFSGKVDGDKMAGTVNMGEYGETSWTALRHKYPQPKQAGR